MFVRFALIAALLLCTVVRVSAEDTETRVTKFGQDLASAWSDYPTEKDITVRKQKVTDLNTAANAEIQKIDAPEGITLQRAVDNFMSNLQRARGLFKQEKMSGERVQYVTICAAAFRREISQASDLAADRTASKAYDLLAGWADNARSTLRTIPDELHAPFFSGLTEAFNRMLKTSSKDTEDPTVIYDKQLKDIKRRFPVTGPFQKTNQPVANILELAAKQVNTRNKMP